VAAGAGKLAGRERAVRGRDAWCRQAHRFVLSAQRGAVAELCTPGAARSAEQSFAAQAAAGDPPSLVVRPDAAVRALLATRKQRPTEVLERMAQLSEPAALLDEAAEARLQVAPAPTPKQRAFLPAPRRPEAAVQAQARGRRAVARQPAESALRLGVQLRAWAQGEAQALGEPVARQLLPSFE
jgi:hypothetical protein